jgi:iron complex outermembrane receptor protein
MLRLRGKSGEKPFDARLSRVLESIQQVDICESIIDEKRKRPAPSGTGTARWGVNMLSSITTSKRPAIPLRTLLARGRIKQTLVSCALTAALLAPGATLAADTAAEEATGPQPLPEVVVTANRREESASKVPISLTALSQDTMDIKGIKDIADVARYTPGVKIDESQTNQIAIRGIASTGGSGTTGIYIDDVPIQVRDLGFNADDALVKIFDLNRVEVLRGPQGTLFGAGSEGGTVRYITNQPSLTKDSVYAKAETSYTQNGAMSYEAGVAAGGPIIDGTLGIRASAWYRRDGGWIDRLDPTTLAIVDSNANHDDTLAMRVAALWQPNDNLQITPSIYFQHRARNDVTIYWPEYSNPNKDQYFSANPAPREEPDNFYIPALNVSYDFGPVRLISTSAYFHRDEISGYDGTLYNLGYYQTLIDSAVSPPPVGANLFPLLDGTGVHLPPGLTNYRAPATVTNQQRNISQEIRLQSNDPASRVQWTAGAFYSLNRQFSLEEIHDPLADAMFNALLGEPIAAFFTSAQNADGSSVLPMGDSYFNRLVSHDRQIAGFGEATIGLTDTLKLIAGVRVSKTTFSIASHSGGPQNTFDRLGGAQNSQTPVTPRAGLDWQIDPNDMVYFTYAKGFRMGGGNPSIPYDPTYQNTAIGCTQDFLNFGIKGAPNTYKSDTVQSFEVGAKNNINNVVRLASSIYYIRWNNIQGNVVPPICQIQWTDNLGNAISKGFDIQANIQATDSLSVDATFGYTDARYTSNAYPSGAVVTPTLKPLVEAGDAIGGPNGIGTGYSIPPWSATLGAEYRFAVLEHESFFRMDYEYAASDKWTHPALDKNTSSYDPTAIPTARQAFASLRTGTNLGGWLVSFFIDNLTDSHTITNYNHQTPAYGSESGVLPNGAPYYTAADLLASPAFRYITYRPRTFGITATYRH